MHSSQATHARRRDVATFGAVTARRHARSIRGARGLHRCARPSPTPGFDAQSISSPPPVAMQAGVRVCACTRENILFPTGAYIDCNSRRCIRFDGRVPIARRRDEAHSTRRVFASAYR
ncbi:hypothetical protein WS86_16020 [Burkholderia savannae]|nr:hypothetical protein WS86_16020 [Burkholderia savannae]